MDNEFDYFLKKFGPPTSSRSVNSSHLARYRETLPCRLLDYWQTYGWCSKHGLFWIVDPAEFVGAMEESTARPLQSRTLIM